MGGRHHHADFAADGEELPPFGSPLLRLTYDYGPNELAMSKYLVGVGEKIAKAMKPSHHAVYGLSDHFDGGAGYGIIHQVGGAITGDRPSNSVARSLCASSTPISPQPTH